jgi:hypothetical protein
MILMKQSTPIKKGGLHHEQCRKKRKYRTKRLRGLQTKHHEYAHRNHQRERFIVHPEASPRYQQPQRPQGDICSIRVVD